MPEDHSVAIALWIFMGIAVGFVALHQLMIAYNVRTAKVKRTLAESLLTAVWTVVILFGA